MENKELASETVSILLYLSLKADKSCGAFSRSTIKLMEGPCNLNNFFCRPGILGFEIDSTEHRILLWNYYTLLWELEFRSNQRPEDPNIGSGGAYTDTSFDGNRVCMWDPRMRPVGPRQLWELYCVNGDLKLPFGSAETRYKAVYNHVLRQLTFFL